MKKFNAGARCAALAAVSAAGILMAQAALAQAVQGQIWVETRAWPQSSFYEEGPVIFRDNPRPAPRYAPPAALPRGAVRQIIEGQGFEVIGPIQFTGDAYIVQAVDQRRRIRRLVVDARDGRIVQSASLVAQPRSGGDMESARGGLPPGGFGSRGEWEYGAPPPAVNMQERRARERFARQSPDGFDAPRDRMDDVNIAPGFNPGPPAVETQRKATPPKQRAVKTPQQKTAPRQAARTPSVESPQSVKAEPTAPETIRRDAARPEPAKVEAAKPEVTRPEVVKPEAPRTEPSKAAAAPAPAQAPAANPRSASRGNNVLRRPSQSAETAAPTPPRTGVAAAPSVSSGATVSTGAEPQRKAPRVVYPGPGAPAPVANGAD